MKNKIFLYNDEGVSKLSLEHTFSMLQQFFPRKPIIKINANEVIDGSWQEDAFLFAIPGGADLLYQAKLKGKGNENIRNFVSNGGIYLGICAGAYYASSYVEFDLGGQLEVIGQRELGFFLGKTVGPALSYYKYNTHEGAIAAEVSFTLSEIGMDTKPSISLYHHGGCFFENGDNLPNINVLANYVIPDKANLAAIILAKFGKGLALLSGVHFEIEPVMLDENDPNLHDVIPKLKESNISRKNMLEYCFKKYFCDGI